MEFRRVTAAGGAPYEEAIALYQSSFPRHEQRLAASQRRIMALQAYHFTLLYDAERWAGLLLYWETADFIYVEHFSIAPALRGHGCGERALRLLAAAGKPVILEIDPPTDAVSVRRKRFYERAGYRENGFAHVHPPYRRGVAGHSLVVMSYPDALSEAAYQGFARYLRDVVMARADAPDGQ